MHPKNKAVFRGFSPVFTSTLALVAVTGIAHGAGFAIYETDARGFGMANANVGRNDDASALYSNPAAITHLSGFQVKAGVSFIMPSIDVTTVGSMDGQIGAGVEHTTAMNSYTAIIPNMYATYGVTDNFSVGLGIFVPYGLKSDFPEDPAKWPGAYNNFYTDIQTFEIAPTIAYRFDINQPWAKSVSIAAGAAVLNLDITIKRQMLLGAGPTYTPLVLEGDTWEYGYNFALQYEVNEKLAFGIVYRSGFDVKVTGADANLVGVQKNSDAWGKMNLPDSWSFGVNYSPIPSLNIGFQALLTRWSSYDKLEIQAFPGSALAVSEKHWDDVWRYSIGVEYLLTDSLALRLGFVFDEDPVNTRYAEYMVPSNDRQIYSVGLGWKVTDDICVDISYGYLKIRSRSIDGRAGDHVLDTFVHTGHAHIVSVSGGIRF